MTFNGLGKAVGNILDQVAAKVALAPHQAGEFVQNNAFGQHPIAKTLKSAGKAIGDHNLNEKTWGVAGELSEKVNVPGIAHHASEYLAKQVTPENQAFGAVMDNATDILSSHIGPIAQWGSQALQTFF
jgi:hypothetical protein